MSGVLSIALGIDNVWLGQNWKNKLSLGSKSFRLHFSFSSIDLDHQATHSQRKLPVYYHNNSTSNQCNKFSIHDLKSWYLFIMSKLPTTASSVPPTTTSPSTNISTPAPMALPSMLPSSNSGINTSTVDGTKAVVNPNQLQRTKMQNVPAFLNKLYKYGYWLL